MSYRDLKNLYAVVFERTTTSNNRQWLERAIEIRLASTGGVGVGVGVDVGGGDASGGERATRAPSARAKSARRAEEDARRVDAIETIETIETTETRDDALMSAAKEIRVVRKHAATKGRRSSVDTSPATAAAAAAAAPAATTAKPPRADPDETDVEDSDSEEDIVTRTGRKPLRWLGVTTVGGA